MKTSITLAGTSPAVTSRDIAELVNSRHSDVMRSIERLAAPRKDGESAAIRLPPLAFSEEINNLGFNVRAKHYVFEGEQGKRDSIVVVAQLSPEFTARLVDRWQELERKAAAPAELSRMDILRMALDSEEKRLAAESALAIAAPKAEFVDRYVTASGSMGFRQVAKMLGAKEPAFRDFLIGEGIMYRLGGALAPKAEHLDTGRFEVKTGASDEGHAFAQARFTAKGVEWIAGLWARRQAREALAAPPTTIKRALRAPTQAEVFGEGDRR